MKRRLLFLLLCIIISVPGCSSRSLRELYNAGEYNAFLNRIKDRTGIHLFFKGRALYETDRYREAAAVLTQAAKPLSAWREASVFYLGKAFAASEQYSAALKQFTYLYEKGKSPIFTRRALYRASEVAGRLKKWKLLSAICNRGLRRFQGSSYFLRNALIAAEKNKDSHLQRKLAFRILKRRSYGKDNLRALAIIRKTKLKTATLSFNKRLLWIEGLIRSGAHGRALRLLRKTASHSPNQRLERDFNLIWVYRLQRKNGAALKLIRRIRRVYAHRAVIVRRTLKHRCRLAARMQQYSLAIRILKKMELKNPGKNRATALHLSRSLPSSGNRQLRFNRWAAKRYPKTLFFQKQLKNRLINLYKRKQYRSFLQKQQYVMPVINDRTILGSLSFFAALSAAHTGQKKAAADHAAQVILNLPCSYYHNELPGALPGIKPTPLPIRTTDDASLICRKLLLFGSSDNENKIVDRLKKLWRIDPLHEALGDSSASLRQLLRGPDQTLYTELLSTGYFREAFGLLYKNSIDTRRSLESLPINLLAAAARLSGRAGAHRSRFVCLLSLFRKSGWGLEVLHMHRLTGAVPVTRALYPRHFKTEVLKWSSNWTLNPFFVFSLIRQESAFQHRITSWAGARGLMQVMPYTAMNIAAETRTRAVDLLIPEQNIRIGTRFLGWLQRSYKNDLAMLIGYNAGPNRIKTWKRRYQRRYRHYDRWGFVESIPYRETKGYIKAVLSNLIAYRTLYKREMHPAQHSRF